MAAKSFTPDELEEMYFNYLYTLSGLGINDLIKDYSKEDFGRLLHEIEFKKFDEHDDSRADDGMGYRYLFATTMRDAYFSQLDYEEFMDNLQEALKGKNCSMLEMMVSLADKMENIMSVNHIETLSKFGTKLDDRNQRTKFMHLKTRYRVLFEGFAAPIGGENVSMDMLNFNTPKGEFERQTIYDVNGDVYYPGKWTWTPQDFTVYDSYDNMNYKELYRQIQLQRDISEQVTGTVSQNYKYVTKFELTDGHQNAIATWVEEGCFLMHAQPDDVANGDHASMTIKCQQSFDNACLYDFDGTLITGSGAVSTLMSKVMAY